MTFSEGQLLKPYVEIQAALISVTFRSPCPCFYEGMAMYARNAALERFSREAFLNVGNIY